MKIKSLAISVATFTVIFGLLSLTATATTFPNLPTTPVNMTVVDGTISYFTITLSNVPAGYDVSNGDYIGWCLDRGHTMSRSTLLEVTLYSSLNPPTELATKPWNKINYILNNKDGHTVDAIQQAIWHFMGWWNYVNLSPEAKQIVDEANANSGFIPTYGQIVAVICLPSDTTQQLSMIEVAPRPPGLSPGYWKHNVNVYITGRGSYSGDPHITAAQLEEYEAYIKANFYSDFTLQWAYNQFKDPKCKGMWLTIANWFNAAAGLAPYNGS